MDNSRHANVDGGKSRRPQLYTKNCKKLKNAESRRNSLSRKGTSVSYPISDRSFLESAYFSLVPSAALAPSSIFFPEFLCFLLPFYSLTSLSSDPLQPSDLHKASSGNFAIVIFILTNCYTIKLDNLCY